MGQARELAAALLEAADELDRWADRGKTRDSPSPPDQTNNGRAAAVFFRFVVAIQQVDNYVSGMRTEEAMIPQVNARDVAQAVELVRALRDQLHQMTHELVRLERLNVNGTSSRGYGHPVRSGRAATRH